MSITLNRDNSNQNVNTNQDGRQIAAILAEYRLIRNYPARGVCRIQKGREKPILVDYQRGYCTCDSYRFKKRGKKTCKHCRPFGIGYLLAWFDPGMGSRSALRASSASIYSDFMDTDRLTCAEAESDFRQGLEWGEA